MLSVANAVKAASSSRPRTNYNSGRVALEKLLLIQHSKRVPPSGERQDASLVRAGLASFFLLPSSLHPSIPRQQHQSSNLPRTRTPSKSVVVIKLCAK